MLLPNPLRKMPLLKVIEYKVKLLKYCYLLLQIH